MALLQGKPDGAQRLYRHRETAHRRRRRRDGGGLGLAMASQRVFRFAPSPNGRLHLGHAYSALCNAAAARAAGARFLLRIEDIDRARCRPEFEQGIVADLAWLGLVFAAPPRRQSEHAPDYAAALAALAARGLVYPCFCTRGEVARAAAGARDPDGAPRYPGTCRALTAADRRARGAAGAAAALRLDMARALSLVPGDLEWREYGEGAAMRRVRADPGAWGDFVLKRKDAPASYHLAVVVDDAVQGVTDVMRGCDLFFATAAHRLLQTLLDLPAPIYRHHRLVRDGAGAKLSKSAGAPALADLRRDGIDPDDLRAALGFGAPRAGALRVAIS
jgi:glutamyl-Q tRNA(Asp) synthetase